jgi:hypothetical protein
MSAVIAALARRARAVANRITDWLVNRRMERTDRSGVDRSLLAVLARRMDAYDLPLPQAIYPGRRGWSVKLASPMDMVKWGAGLGFEGDEASPAGLVRWGLTRHRWRIAGRVKGIPVEVWAAYEQDPIPPSGSTAQDAAAGDDPDWTRS